MNIQHSSRTDQWFTPQWIVDKVRLVLGDIDLDPASSPLANERIKAKQIITEAKDGLTTEWPAGSLFCNPPGGKIGNKSKTGLFWAKLMKHRDAGKLSHGIFLCFSAEALQTTQGKDCPPVGAFIVCIPKKRVAFDTADGLPGDAPSHSNCIVYVPGNANYQHLFHSTFKDVGSILYGVA